MTNGCALLALCRKVVALVLSKWTEAGIWAVERDRGSRISIKVAALLSNRSLAFWGDIWANAVADSDMNFLSVDWWDAV